MSNHHILVCMRLADMTVRHPDQDESHVCADCGQTVCLSPTSMRSLNRQPDIVINCQVCGLPKIEPEDRVVSSARTATEFWREFYETERLRK